MAKVIKVFKGRTAPFTTTPFPGTGAGVSYEAVLFSEVDKRAEEIGYYRENSVGFNTQHTNVSYLGNEYKVIQNKMFGKGKDPRLTLRFHPKPDADEISYYFFRPLGRVLKWVTVRGDITVGLKMDDKRFFTEETDVKFRGKEFFATLGKKKLGVVEITYANRGDSDITDTFLIRGLFCAQITHDLGVSLGKLIDWAEGDNLARLYMALMMMDRDEVIQLEKEMLGTAVEEPPIERPQAEVN